MATTGSLGGRALWALEQALRGVGRRHEAILQNVANVETPGYARRDVAFRGVLRRALARTRAQPLTLEASDRRHMVPDAGAPPMGEIRPRAVRTGSRAVRSDGNGVSLDREMALLSENALEYQVLTRQVSRRLAMLRRVITEGGR